MGRKSVPRSRVAIAKSIKSTLDDMMAKVTPQVSNFSIYKVHENLRKMNEGAYTPSLVSIGPFHHGDAKLWIMQEEKSSYLKKFMERTHAPDISVCIHNIMQVETEAREHYAPRIQVSSEAFVQMLLLDAVFVLEFVLRLSKSSYTSELNANDSDQQDQIISQPSVKALILLDLLLLENQIPYFVIEIFYKLLCLPRPLHCLIIDVFKSEVISSAKFSAFDKQSIDTISNREEIMAYHLLDVFRKCYVSARDSGPVQTNIELTGMGSTTNQELPLRHANEDESTRTRSWARTIREALSYHPARQEYVLPVGATQLHHAGVKFQEHEPSRTFEIKFLDGTLKMSKIKIGANSEQLLRNLMAYEQYHHHSKTTFTDIVCFLDSLIDTQNDVSILQKSGILEHELGCNEEVAALINSLRKGVIVDFKNIYQSEVSEKLNAFAQGRWNKWKVKLGQDYFHNPWTTTSFIAATILVVATMIQTGFTVYEVIA